MSKAPEVIHTARLRLRRPVAADAEAIFASFASDSEVTRYMAWPTHVSLADTHGFLSFAQDDWQQQPAGTYLVELNGGVIGSTGIHFGRPDTDTGSAETGYVFVRRVWGHGYAAEVLQAMVMLATQLDLRELTAGCHPENLASRRVLEKCGFAADSLLQTGKLFPNASPAVVAGLVYRRQVR